MSAHVLLSLLIFEHGFIQVRFGFFEFFTRYLFYQILHGIFSLQTQFFIDKRNIRNECWILK